MMIIVLILLGIGCEIVMANEWFIIPYFVPYILFGIAGGLLVINIISWISAKRKFKRTENCFNRRWRL